MTHTWQRRQFVQAASTAAGLVLVGCGGGEPAPRRPREADQPGGEAEVTPVEDLMQEHGVVERLMLMYGEVVQRIVDVHPFDLASLGQAAQLVRHFVEDYHEQNEEEFVFPRLEKAKREVELVATLRAQHARGRELTDQIIRIAGSGPADADLAHIVRGFERMYRAHAAREDTVLFRAFRDVISPAEYRELGEQMEEREHQRFGQHGFEDVVGEVARIEATLDLADLARLTA